jgi:hypothetical protein
MRPRIKVIYERGGAKMSNTNTPNTNELKNLQAIPKWTRRYAQNRTLPFMLFMVIFLLMFAGIGGSSYIGGNAYRSGNIFLFWFAMVFLATGIGFCLWFSAPWWGGRWMEKQAEKLYSDEGYVKLGNPRSGKNTIWLYLVGVLYGACILLSVVLGMKGYIPIEYMQPVSALYVVPFLVFLSIRLHPFAGWLPLLWPILYGLHAILVVCGVPIQSEKMPSVNMLIPIAGYGLLCGLIGHLYGRYALMQLKKTACSKE